MKRLLTWIGIGIVLAGGYFGSQVWLKNYEQKRISEIEDNETWNTEYDRAIAMSTKYQRMQKVVDDFAAKYDIGVHAEVVDLRDGVTARNDDKEEVLAASLYKYFVGYRVYQMIEKNELSPRDSTNAGYTVADCLDLMIRVSNNECGKALGDLVGWQKLDEQLAAEGYNDTTLNNYTATGALDGDKITSARDIALFLERLYTGQLMDDEHKEEFIDYMKKQGLDDWFAADKLAETMPSTVVASKTGDLEGYIHDSGIFYGPKGNYAVVLLTGPWRAPYADSPAAFHEFATAISLVMNES